MHDIFSHFISRDTKDDGRRVGYILWFVDTFPSFEFKGEDFIMRLYCEYCARLGVPMKSQYFSVYLSTELRKILIETRVKLPGTDNLSYDEPTGLESAYQVATEYLQNEFSILESYSSDIQDFPVAADAYMSQRLSERTVEELGKAYEVLSSSDNSQATVDYALDRLILLRDIYSKEHIDQLEDVALREVGTTDFNFVTDTGIRIIDDDISGVYTTQLFSVEAQPGTGKTRFALGVMAYRTAVLYKKNVVYYQLEQTEAEAISMLVARHVFTLYNIQISSGMIQFNRVPPELQDKVTAARIDLFESGKYGKIKIINTDLYYETLEQVFRKDDKLFGPFDLVIVDYMGLIMQKPDKYHKEKLDYQVIAESYRKMKHYMRSTRKCGLAVSQLNREGIAAGKADKEITPEMAQGGIVVYKHTDQNLALTRTATMEAQQKMRVSQPKKRGTEGFGTTVIDTRLGFCYFIRTHRKRFRC